MSLDLYAEVTNQIVAMLEKGVVPWRSPILGQGKAGHPRNLESGKQYRGVNVFLLAFTAWIEGYGSAYWLTFNQAKQRGGSVRKGEKASMVVFWKECEVTDRETGELKKVPIMRYYNVFNLSQCDGIEAPDAVKFTPLDFKPIEAAEALIKGYADGPAIEHGGLQACYRPTTDTVRLNTDTDYVVADGPGSQTETSRALLLRADLAIVPCKASMLEVRALAKATEVLRVSQDIRAGLPKAIIVLSMVGKNYRLTADMKDAAAALNLPLASRAMILRQIYADAPGQGAVVWNMGSRAREAAEEVDQIFREILPDAAGRRATRVSLSQ
jgi:hypothetical protein